eukprot:scaffold16334_cov133-Isochrysis_galbana.AAC.2
MDTDQRALSPGLVNLRVHRTAGGQATRVEQLAQVAHRSLELRGAVKRRRRNVGGGARCTEETQRLGGDSGRLQAKCSVYLGEVNGVRGGQEDNAKESQFCRARQHSEENGNVNVFGAQQGCPLEFGSRRRHSPYFI